jgi:acyl-CoA synthetase (AMP-forming)/AMP-acid ligase II
MEIPREYNAAVDLIGRNLAAGRGAKTAYIDDGGSCTYAQLAERVDRAANALRSLGIRREERVAIAMLDSADWVAVFLGAIKAGIVPVALNTLLTPADYAYQIKDSGAKALFVSDALLKNFESIAPTLEHVIPQSQLSVLLQKQMSSEVVGAASALAFCFCRRTPSCDWGTTCSSVCAVFSKFLSRTSETKSAFAPLSLIW